MTTYKEAGVDVKKNERLVEMIKNMSNISTGFSSIQDIGMNQFLAFSADGVGTKIKLARYSDGVLDTIGDDLVGMCANDLICSGAKPMWFMDYIGMNHLKRNVVEKIIQSILNACNKYQMELVGGEMAEMPQTYIYSVPELVGFAVGIGNSETKINKKTVCLGDKIIGLASSGPHSNGYSLINKIDMEVAFETTEYQMLIAPTILYNAVSKLHQNNPILIKSMAHITGGGLLENVQRAIPDDMVPDIDFSAFDVPEVFRIIQYRGKVPEESMKTTFNMGIGLCLIVDDCSVSTIIENLKIHNPKVIGEIKNAR